MKSQMVLISVPHVEEDVGELRPSRRESLEGPTSRTRLRPKRLSKRRRTTPEAWDDAWPDEIEDEEERLAEFVDSGLQEAQGRVRRFRRRR